MAIKYLTDINATGQNVTSNAFIKDGGTSNDVLLADGTTTSLSGITASVANGIVTANVSGTYTFDISNNRLFNLTMTADTNFTMPTISNGTVERFKIILTGGFSPDLLNTSVLTPSVAYDGSVINEVDITCYRTSGGTQFNYAFVKNIGGGGTGAGGAGAGVGVTDGDKGDIVVSDNGTTWLLDTIPGLTAGQYTRATVTVDTKGRVTAISSNTETPGVEVLNDLTDVTIGTLNPNQVLTWNGTNWANELINFPSDLFDLQLNDVTVGDVDRADTFSFNEGIGIDITHSTATNKNTLTFALTNTGVSANSYTNANITVDAQGRITAASSGSNTVDFVSNVISARILGRVTAGTGNSEELTAAQVRTLINVEDGATANSTDAFLLSRANHTGSQAISTITNLQTTLDNKLENITNENLQDLANVTITTPSSGQVLKYNGTIWINDTDSGAGASNLEVEDEGISLTASATKLNFTGAGVTASNSSGDVTVNIPVGALNDLSDVSVASPAPGQVLKWNGSTWTAQEDLNNYSWSIAANGTAGTSEITNGNTVTFNGSGETTVTRSGDNITISSTSTTYTAGDLLDLSGTTFNVDLSELISRTSFLSTPQLVVLDGVTQRKMLLSNINLSLFNNDLSFGNGTVTNVTVGTGLDITSSTTTPNITLDLSEFASTATFLSTDEFIVLDGGLGRKIVPANIDVALFDNSTANYTSNIGTITAVNAGNGLTGGGSSGSVTLNIGSSSTISVSSDSISVTSNSIGATQLNVVGNGTPGQLLQSDGDGSFSWFTLSLGLGDLSDVTLATANQGEFLRYFNGAWRDSNLVINDANDVAVSTPTEGQIFQFTGSTWSNVSSPTIPGNVTADNFILSSDKRIKENIKSVSSTNYIKVDWKTYTPIDSDEKRYGVIAQELEEKHPEFVNTNDKGMKSVKYIDLLIAKIAELENRIKQLEK